LNVPRGGGGHAGTLWFTDNRQEGVFVGLWVPSILAAGAFWTVAIGRDR